MTYRKKLFAKTFVSVLILIILIYQIDVTQFVDVFKTANLYSMALAFLVLMASDMVRCVKHKIIMLYYDKKIPITDLYIVNLRIFSLSMVLPGEIVGGFARLALMKKFLNTSEVISFIVLDKFTQLAVTFLLGAILSIYFYPKGNLIIGFGLTSAVLFGLPYVFKIAIIKNTLLKIFNKINQGATLKVQTRDLYSIKAIYVYAFSLAYHISRAYYISIICYSIGIELSILIIIVYLSLIMFMQLLPISFGGLGVREITTVGFLGMYGVGLDQAMALSLLIYFFSILRALIGLLVNPFR